MMTGSDIVGWPVASAIASVALAAVYLSSMVIRSFTTRMKSYDRDKHEDDLIRIALFGRPADPPLEPITGLIADNKETKQQINVLQQQISALQVDVKELLNRTTENGGSSLKDQMNRIERQTRAE
jgi:TolA-binding protein